MNGTRPSPSTSPPIGVSFARSTRCCASSDAGRAVFITTGLAHAANFRPYWGPYAASKAALEALARTYAEETKNITPVRVMLVNPGPIRTKMRAKAMPGEDPKILKTPEEIAPRIAALCAPEWTETGKLYDFPQDRVLHFSDPA